MITINARGAVTMIIMADDYDEARHRYDLKAAALEDELAGYGLSAVLELDDDPRYSTGEFEFTATLSARGTAYAMEDGPSDEDIMNAVRLHSDYNRVIVDRY